MNIINDPYSSRTAGVGQGITTALQGLLEGVTHGKAKDLHARAMTKYGYDNDKATAFVNLPPELQKIAFQQGMDQESLQGILKGLAGEQQSQTQQMFQQAPQNQFAQARQNSPLPPQLQQVLSALQQRQGQQSNPQNALQGNVAQNLEQQNMPAFMRALQNPHETSFLDSLPNMQGQPQQQSPAAQAPQMSAQPQKPQITAEQLRNAAAMASNPRVQQHLLKSAAALAETEKAATSKQEKDQKNIETKNKPFRDRVSQSAAAATQGLVHANRAEELLNTNKVASGTWGRLPEDLQNAETNEYVSEVNKLVSNTLQAQKGVPSGVRMKYVQMEKPILTYSRAAQKNIIKNAQHDLQEATNIRQAIDDIVEENGGKEPSELEAKVTKRLHTMNKNENRNETKQASSFSLDSSAVPEGKLVQGDDGKYYRKVGNKFVLQEGR